MNTTLNLPTKRRYGNESALLYTGHSANCNCSCDLNELLASQQQHNKRRNNSFTPVIFNAPHTVLEKDSACLPSVQPSNDWGASSGHQVQFYPEFNSLQHADSAGCISNLPPLWLSSNGSENPNLYHYDGTKIYEPIASGSQWPLQNLWNFSEQTGESQGPKENRAFDELVQDAQTPNSYDPSELLPLRLSPLSPWFGEYSILQDHSQASLDQSGNFANESDNSPLDEFEAASLFIGNDSTALPIRPSSSTGSQQIVSSNLAYETSKTPKRSLSFKSTLLRPSEVQIPTETKWDTSFRISGSNLPLTNNLYRVKAETQHPKRIGKRQGPLKPENAKRAAQIRRQRACWLCWLSKVPCSPEITCYKCSTLQSSLVTSRICIRARLADYTNLFFPEQMIAHLRVSAVQKAVNDNVSEFSKSSMEIKVTSGQDYPTMNLNVRVFRAREQAFLAIRHLNTDVLTSDLPVDATVTSYALPLGLLSKDVILLKRNCLEHIKCMTAEESDWILQNAEIERGFDLSWRVFSSIERYRRKSIHTNELDYMLRRATMLYAMHDFMGRVITIADGTGHRAFEHPDIAKGLTYSFELISKILNRQLKHAMHLLLQETTRDVLDRLEQELRNRTKTKASWAPCFCTILILCICIEELQIAVDRFAVHKATGKNKTNCFSRASGFETSRQLDDLLYNDCKTIFHAIHNSHKPKSGLRNQKEVFNPIRDAYDINEKDGVTQAMHDLVGEIHDILGDLGNDVVDRAKAPSVDSEDESLTAHMAFRERNSGRLVSDFLRSFLDSTS